jgi:hypothetical protein
MRNRRRYDALPPGQKHRHGKAVEDVLAELEKLLRR